MTQITETITPSAQNLIERKAAAADDATLFMQELLDSVESLTGIAKEHGARTLADLMYLQAAILEGGFIDHWPEESAAMKIASGLPSGERWAKFIKKDDCNEASQAGYLVSPGWGHIFVGQHEETTRWIYDCTKKTLVCAQVLSGNHWVNLDKVPMADLLESIHDNEANENPDDFDLIHFDSQPSWHEVSEALKSPETPLTQRG